MKISLAIPVKDNEEKPPCKGVFYRVTESAYLTQRGFAKKLQVDQLKSLSCPGCDSCLPMYDFLAEELNCGAFPEFLTPLQSGGVYQLKFNGHRGYYPEDDDCWLELRIVEGK